MTRWPIVLLLALALATALVGCAGDSNKISTTYGGRRGDAAASVNGLSILAGMFQRAGHQVTSRSNAGSGIDDAQVIVWAPDNFAPPNAEECELIEIWLGEQPHRTFVYIGRDYDAALAYWRRMADKAPPAQFAAAAREAALAESAHDTARSAIPAGEDCDWFTVHRDRARTRVDALSGDWSAGIDAAKAEIVLQAQFDVSAEDKEGDAGTANDEYDDEYVEDTDIEQAYDEEDTEYDDYDFTLLYEVLLSAGTAASATDDPFDEKGGLRPADGAPLVTRVTCPIWGNSQLLVVTNASFLLNLPLVNHEHRKLAGRLIDVCGEPGKVVIWESTTFRASSAEQENDWSVLTTWPLNFILLHLAVLGMLYILWRFPIFGLAHQLRSPATSDFAKHVDALGKLMAATNNEAYARRKVAEYHECVRRDARDAT